MRIKLIAIIFPLLLLFKTPSYADLVNPEFYTKKCNDGEIRVTCNYRRETINGPFVENTCTQYEDNPDYYFLTGEGHTFGGTNVYCKSIVFPRDGKNPIRNDGFYALVILGIIILSLSVTSFYFLLKIRRANGYS